MQGIYEDFELMPLQLSAWDELPLGTYNYAGDSQPTQEPCSQLQTRTDS